MGARRAVDEAGGRTLPGRTPAAVYTAVPDGASIREIGWGEGVKQLTGWSVREMLRRRWSDLVLPEDRGEFLAPPGARRWNEATYRIRRRDGSVCWVRDIWTHVDPDRWVGIVLDDSTDRAAREALRRNRTELEEAQRLAHLGSWSWDAETDRTEWSAELFRIYGLEPGPRSPSYEEQTPWYPPASKARLDAAVAAARASGIPYEVEYEIVRPDGARRLLTTRAEPLLGPEGRVAGLRGTVADITESALARERLEARLRLEARIAALARRLASEPSPLIDLTIVEILGALGAHVSADTASLVEYDAPGSVLRAVWRADGSAPPGDGSGRHRHGPREHPWVHRRLARGRRVVVPDIRDLPAEAAAERRLWGGMGIRSRTSIPIRPEGRLIAALSFGDFRPRRWADEELDLLETVADLVGHSLVRARERQVRERLARASDAILGVTGQPATAPRRLGAIVTATAEAFGMTRVALVRGTDPARIVAAVGDPPGDEGWEQAGATVARRSRPLVDPAAGLVAVPVRGSGAGWGALVLGPGEPVRTPSPVELEWLAGIARFAGTETMRFEHEAALRRSATQERERAAALDALSSHLSAVRENERELLAREVHDDLGQVLGLLRSVALRLAGTEDLPDRLRPRCHDLADLAAGALESSRRIIEDLRPPALTDLGLDGALRALASDHAERSGVPVRIRLDPLPADLPEALALDLYRVAQEALGNAIRHAHPTRIAVRVRSGAGRILLAVENDGLTEEGVRSARRYGLAGMEERARRWGGRSRAGARVDRWIVELRVPLPEAAR